MKKILILIDSLTCGGAEKSLISLLPLLDYSKVRVDLILVERGGVCSSVVLGSFTCVGETPRGRSSLDGDAWCICRIGEGI